MHSDLEQLIQLQDLDTAADRARRAIGDIPQQQQALDARLADKQAVVTGVKDRIAAMQAARRELEKELAAVQTRLSKFKDQLMAVKTNKEYQAMQKEMAVAETEVRTHEDKLLDRMEEAETLATELKAAEAALKAEQAAVAREQSALDGERQRQEQELARLVEARAQVIPKLSKEALSLFERVAHGRKGIAIAEARDGLCTVCHVRLRPQVFNDARRNDMLIQCESCTRILYTVPAQPQQTA
jgi:predicted  nucleic acid-binding Zn-ribbon protein